MAVAILSGYEALSVKFRVIHMVAVRDDFRGNGLGTLCLNGALQRFEHTATHTYGNCAPDEAPFFARAGYTVLDPGTPFPFLSGGAVLQINSAIHPCGFYGSQA